jgi:flagellar P-ring protein precursor FlgI
MRLRICVLLVTCLAALAAPPPFGVRIKELASVEGVRDNPLIGYGIVVGLNGTGDRQQTLFSVQSLSNMLREMGVSVTSGTIRVQDTGAVMVSANLPPFARPGSKIDITVAAIGDAVSLQGGILILTSLRGVDGKIYAIAQGPLVLGAYLAGRGNNSQTLNHPTTGRIPAGAIVEVAAPRGSLRGSLRLQLRQADFTTATRITAVINRRFPDSGTWSSAAAPAQTEDSAAVSVAIPTDYAQRPAEFIAEIERLTVEADSVERVVVNERTGTIVMGRRVNIQPVTVMHGALTVEIQTVYEVSQPAPFSQGTTQVVPQTTVKAREEKARNISLPQGSTVEDLVQSLNAIGATARDVISILQGLQSAGALRAEIQVI